MEELRGLLAVGVLPETFRKIFLARRTGVLHLASGGDRADIEFRDGHLVSASSTLGGANLGDLLIQSGLLSARDRDACLEIGALTGERLGETLLRHALLDSEQLSQGLALQLREVLARTLLWEAGVYLFTDSPKETSARPLQVPKVDPREVLLDAVWILAGDPALDRLAGDTRQVLRRGSDERLQHLDFRLTPENAFLLSRVDGTTTAATLLGLLPASPDEARASLAGLLAVGAIEYGDVPAPTSMTAQMSRVAVARLGSRINSSDPYEVLDVKPGDPGDVVRAAYVKLLTSCNPATTADPQFRPILGQMSNQLTLAYKEIERRRNTPRPAEIRRSITGRTTRAAALGARTLPPAPPPPKEPAPPQALKPAAVASPAKPPASAAPPVEPQQANEAAARALEAGLHLEALTILHEAIPHLSGQARRAARVRKAKVLLAVENGHKLAEDELKTAIAEDAANADAHVALAGIYRERGSLALAMMEYRRALAIQPKNTVARTALDELVAPPTPKAADASVLQRILGRPAK